ncbi:Oidioi.mRNA.OKI2018_I69.chr1.g2963.t1.cds [Oikopleura dioica]|uniref:Oidioi.mRNA.OKI2018_I69.chr1.g2963.t1.cds n=1 Tax=Oikopleura dioica TaxID=34765 RepID=A0ABN7SSK9_OIKDI|nr:Oidioi.mRNA.OKI2018_I69.chr1.g2963.t1.cds [Oikopleura dioica]
MTLRNQPDLFGFSNKGTVPQSEPTKISTTALATLASANRSPTYNNAVLHLDFQDGAANMVRELFKDYGWPDLVTENTGFSFLEYIDDFAVASCMTATFTGISTTTNNNALYTNIDNFKTRVANDQNTQDLYASLAGCMSGITFSRTEMSNYFINFPVGNFDGVDLGALMTSVADKHFQNAQDAATAFEAQTDFNDASNAYLNSMRALRSAFKQYNAGISNGRNTVEQLIDYAQLAWEFIEAGLYVYENEMEAWKLGERYYNEILNIDTIVYKEPLRNACLKKVGPFGLAHQMMRNFYRVLYHFDVLFQVAEISERYIAEAIWGQTFTDTFYSYWTRYFYEHFQHISQFGGEVEAWTSLAAEFLDPYLQDPFYNAIAVSFCGFEEA